MNVNIYNEQEIAKIRAACLITAQALDYVEEEISSGMSTLDIDKLVEEFILEKGGKPAFKGYCGYKHTICSSVNEEIVHGIPSSQKILKEGDIVGIDLGTILDGFYSDSCRTFPIGSISEEATQLLDITQKSLSIGIEQFFAGNRLNTLSHSIQLCIENAGYSVVKEYVGHGIGRSLHEDPPVPNFATSGTDLLLKKGMVFAIEPMVNLGSSETEVLEDGWTVVTKDRKLSAHFEHTIALTEKGTEVLTLCLKKKI